MFTGRFRMLMTLAALVAAMSATGTPSFAAVDSLVQVVSGANATGGALLD